MTSISTARGNATYTLSGWNGVTLFTNSGSVNATRVITNSMLWNYTNLCVGGNYGASSCGCNSFYGNIVVLGSGNTQSINQVAQYMSCPYCTPGSATGFPWAITNCPVTSAFWGQGPVAAGSCTGNAFWYYPGVPTLNGSAGPYASSYSVWPTCAGWVQICCGTTNCTTYIQGYPLVAGITQQFWMAPSDTLKACEYYTYYFCQYCSYGSGKTAGTCGAGIRVPIRNIAYSFTLVNE